jgi:transaldolase
MNQLDALRQWTTVVVDTGDFLQIDAFKPRDVTTNPSLILKAAKKAGQRHMLDAVLREGKGRSMDEIIDRLLVRFGCEILSLVPGRVSTEVDARLSFDTAATIERAERIVALYRAQGIDTERRLLIKIAATWEGIQAARQLENKGIHCNLTLLFSLAQAALCGAAKVRLISPFVGRIYDWHKQAAGSDWVEADHVGARDLGVRSVREIYDYYKQHGIATEVMGASFRNLGQIEALAGCDLLTISPELLDALASRDAPLVRALDPRTVQVVDRPPMVFDEPSFRQAINQDAMASEKLAEGIRTFSADAAKLEQLMSR